MQLYDEHRQIMLSKDEAKHDELNTNYDLYLREGIDNLSLSDRKARDSILSKIARLKRELSKATIAKQILETKIQ